MSGSFYGPSAPLPWLRVFLIALAVGGTCAGAYVALRARDPVGGGGRAGGAPRAERGAVKGGAAKAATPPAIPDGEGATAALTERIAAACGGTPDEAVIDAAARRFGDRALNAATVAGVSGLVTLTSFGAEAEELLVADEAAFVRLAPVGGLSGTRLGLAAGPWREYVLRWARDARHDRVRRFADRLGELPDEHAELATVHPAALPLLFVKAPNAHAAVAELGGPALDVLLSVDAAGHPDVLDFVGKRLREEKGRIAFVSANYGPAAAYLLVGPPGAEDKGRALPGIVRFALDSELPREEVLAVFLTALPVVLEDLRGGVPASTIRAAFTRYANLDTLVRMLVADHPLTLRLLAEETGGVALGARALERCGPDAADVVFGLYSALEVRPAVLATLATVGWGGKDEPVRGLLREAARDGEFLSFLKRAVRERLHEGNSPLLPRGVLALSVLSGADRAELLKTFRSTNNLAGELERFLVPRDGGLWEWVPGYSAVTTFQDWQAGLHVSKRDALLAGLDAADAVMTVYTLGTSSVVTGGRTAGKQIVKQAGKEALETGAEKLAQRGARMAASHTDDAVRRVLLRAPHLERLGAQGTKAATTRVAARARGVAARELWDAPSLERWSREAVTWAKREGVEWATNVPGRALDASKLTVAHYPKVSRWLAGVAADGAAQYARAAGYVTVYVETVPQPHGLNHVFRDGDRMVVIEAIAPGLGHRTLDGFEQGTIEYAEAAAKRVCGGDHPEALKKVAAEVLAAIAARRLDVETVVTDHAAGVPTLVRVLRVVGPDGDIRPEVDKDSRALPGWAVALLADYKLLSHGWSVGSWLRYQAGVAGRLGIRVWPETGAQTPANFPAGGRPGGRLIRVLPAGTQIGQMSEFAAALVELLL